MTRSEPHQATFDGEPLPAALCSAIAAEFEAALAAVAARADAPEKRVHNTRKHLKRWRALRRLLPRPTEARLRRVQHVVQLVAQRLGSVRDPVAQRETWLQFASDHEERERFEPVTERLDRTCREQTERGTVLARLQRAERALTVAGLELKAALQTQPQTSDTGLGALTDGFWHSYRRARRALRRALRRPTNKRLHALRRANKVHQYQLQFLEPLWKKPLKAERSQAKKLSEQLGEHHDLSGISLGLNRAGDAAPLSARPQLEAWQRDLELRALRRAALVYGERPRALRQRIRDLIDPPLWLSRSGTSLA